MWCKIVGVCKHYERQQCCYEDIMWYKPNIWTNEDIPLLMLVYLGSLVVAKVFMVSLTMVFIISSCDKLHIVNVIHFIYIYHEVTSYPKMCNIKFDL